MGVAFALVTIGACVLLGNRFTHTSWPLQRAHMGLVFAAVFFYFVSYIFRALGWQKLFPASERPDRARCLTACGAAAASGVVLPFRLDYLVKIGTLRRMRGVKLGLEAIALSIISLGLVDAVAFLPLSISATATSSSTFRVPLMLVVIFGFGSCGLLVGGQHLLRIPLSRVAPGSRSSSGASPSTRAERRARQSAPVLPARLLEHAGIRKHAPARGARSRVLADPGAHRALFLCRGVLDPDRLGRCGRQRWCDRGGAACARRSSRPRDQLRPCVRAAALWDGGCRRDCRAGHVARLRCSCSFARRSPRPPHPAPLLRPLLHPSNIRRQPFPLPPLFSLQTLVTSASLNEPGTMGLDRA